MEVNTKNTGYHFSDIQSYLLRFGDLGMFLVYKYRTSGAWMFRDSLKLRANAPEQIGKINFFCCKIATFHIWQADGLGEGSKLVEI